MVTNLGKESDKRGNFSNGGRQRPPQGSALSQRSEWREEEHLGREFPGSGHSVCNSPEGDCPGESGKSQEVRVAAAETSGGQVMRKGGGAQARGCLQELGARFVWSEFHFNKDCLAVLWGINCRGQG